MGCAEPTFLMGALHCCGKDGEVRCTACCFPFIITLLLPCRYSIPSAKKKKKTKVDGVSFSSEEDEDEQGTLEIEII